MNLRPRVSLNRTTGLTLAGDLLCIGLFVGVGALQHPEGTPLYLRVPVIAAPFAVGWLLVGSITGAFTPDALVSPRPAATGAAVTWVGADIVGQAFRATPFVSGGVAPAFVVVSLLVGGGLLVGWRVLVARVVSG